MPTLVPNELSPQSTSTKCKCDDCAVKHICAKKKGVKEIAAPFGLLQEKVIVGPSLSVAYARCESCENERVDEEQFGQNECTH